MWALTYDYLVGYSMKDMSPQPELATKWTTSDDGLTWTFDIREGVKWSDGEPLTAKDVAYTYNRVLDGGPEAVNWGSYLKGVTSATAPDDTHVVLKLSKPIASLPLLPIPIVPEHIWKNVSEDDVKSYAAEPEDGKPVVGSGPFRLVEGTAGGSTYRFEANPDYWGGAPHIDEVVFRVYKSEDPMVQALIKGEVDFAEDITPLQVKALAGGAGDHRPQRRRRPASTRSRSTPARSTPRPASRSATPTRRCWTRSSVTRSATRWTDQLIADKVYQGAGEPGTTIIPPAYSDCSGNRPRTRRSPSTWTRPASCSTRPATRWAPTGCGRCRTGRRSAPCGSRRAATRRRTRRSTRWTTSRSGSTTSASSPRWSPYTSSRLTEVILEGNFDAFEWGWYVEPDPDGMLSYFTCDQRGGLSDSWYCNKKYDELYEQQHVEIDHAKRVGHGQADAADDLRGLAVPGDRRTRRSARRCAATGSRASSPSPTRAASG